MHRFHTILAVIDRQTDTLLSQRPALRNMRRADKESSSPSKFSHLKHYNVLHKMTRDYRMCTTRHKQTQKEREKNLMVNIYSSDVLMCQGQMYVNIKHRLDTDWHTWYRCINSVHKQSNIYTENTINTQSTYRLIVWQAGRRLDSMPSANVVAMATAPWSSPLVGPNISGLSGIQADL